MSTRQLAMVINLDKCIGCQTCTVACSTHRLHGQGQDMLRYIWVETKPGLGWPKGWMEMGRRVPDRVEDYGGTWTFNWEEVYSSQWGTKYLRPVIKETGEPVKWGPIWEEDQGGGQWPNGYFFYMPRLCNHCSEPPCVKACEEEAARKGTAPAMRKRAEDGVVVIEARDEAAIGLASCPYKIPMENIGVGRGKYEMCDFCLMRTANNYSPVCAKSCPARAMYFGYLDDPESFVHKLVRQYKVALPLRPDFGTEPNVYYVPPFIRPSRLGDGNRPSSETDVPFDLLRSYFGPEAEQALATLRAHREKAENGEPSELMDLLIIYRWADAFTPFSVDAPQNPIG